MHDGNFGLTWENYLAHYGVKRRSGRYPWGSGDNPFQHSGDFIARYDELRAKGMSEKDIVKELQMSSTTELRLAVKIAQHERRATEVAHIKSLVSDGYTYTEIGRMIGKNESSVRSLLKEDVSIRKNTAANLADTLKQELEEKGAIDIGKGVERTYGVSSGTLREAVYMLELEGYNRFGVGIQQVTNPNQQTNNDILSKPDIQPKDVYADPSIVKPAGEYHSIDGGKTFERVQYPASIDSNRVMIRYRDDGGLEKDGVIEIRRGVEDLSLGDSYYSQVRILVDGDRYLKGMAIYSDDMPKGVDVIYNSNKDSSVAPRDVMKKIGDDPTNPFGAYIKASGQSYYIGEDGKQHLGAINKLKEEGDWETQAKTLSSQFLSKQNIDLINKQLNLTYNDYADQYKEIQRINNPVLKQKMLVDFADTCDSAAVHLKASALPGQTAKVILPIGSLKDNECYCPTFSDGTKLALIRYPHGGTFEIPLVTVNNKNKEGKKILGDVTDAIGINSKVAEQLSGADFDGDSVTVIPTSSKVKISHREPLRGLQDFDPKLAYPYKEGMRVMSKEIKGKKMGEISNLITDMTIQGAPDDDIVRAVKHSMVVIDAEKHKLNYKQSELDNNISELKKRYQGRVDPITGSYSTSAATLISRHKQEVAVPERQGSPRINEKTGELEYKSSNRKYIDKKGNIVEATTKVPLLLQTKDLNTLSSGTKIEKAYADYGNKLKIMANEARKESLKTGKIEYSPAAKARYSVEVDSLNRKLANAEVNQPKERNAHRIANSVIKAKVEANPALKDDKKELRKQRQMAINDARVVSGASGKMSRITFTEKEWEAINAGALTTSKVRALLTKADQDQVKKLATPKSASTPNSAKIALMQSMRNSGYTLAQIAERTGYSASTISKFTTK